MTRGHDHIRQMHQMCVEELQNLQENIADYCQSSARLHKQLSAHWRTLDDVDCNDGSNAALPLIAYDNFMSNLSHVMEMARKFNLHLRFNKLGERNFRDGFRPLLTRDSTNNNINNNNCQALHLPNGCKKDLNLSWHLHAQAQEDAEQFVRYQSSSPRTLLPPPGFECTPVSATAENINTVQSKTEVDEQTLTPAHSQTNFIHETPDLSKEDAAPSSIPASSYDFTTLSIPPVEEAENENDESALFDAQILGRVFNYPEKELASYQPGCLIDASITFVQDSRRLRFFICDAKSPDMASILELHHMVNLRQYSSLPPANEIFGIVLDEVILRAVRANKSEAIASTTDENAYPAFLLDFGEVVEVSAANDIMYYLPAELQKIPAQAMLCQLHCGASDDPNYRDTETLQTVLEQLEYKRVSFRVEALVEQVLHLHLITKDDYNVPTPQVIPNTNPFKQSAAAYDKDNDELTLQEDIAASDPTEQVVPLQPISRDPFDSIAATLSTSTIPPNGLTRDDWEMLYEEPLATTNAMTAVMGYDPKDDLRICRFYDPKIGACFKGANCKQEHIASQPDGWTKDVLPAATIVDNRMPAMRYEPGAVISVTPTYVGQLERFYAQIEDPKSQETPLIWNPEDVPQWKRLQKPPLIFELVLARYDDELWYRAKIMEVDEQGKMFHVFYVDYGNHQVVPLRDLARCDYTIAQLPFQAVLCRIAHVRDEPAASPELRQRGINTLCKLILNQTFDMKVVAHHEDLLVRFIDQRFTQVPGMLIGMGCMRPFKTVPM